MRLPRTAYAVALLAGCALLMPAPPAHAKRGKKNQGERVELVRPVDGSDADASGVLRVKTKNNGARRIVVKLENLDPKTWYEIRDLDTDELLGTVRTNKRGKARKKLKLAARDAQKASTGGEDGVAVVRQNDQANVLEGDMRSDDAADEVEPGYAFGWYGEWDDINAQVSMFAEEDLQSFSLTLCIPGDDETEEALYELFATDGEDDSLPLDVSSVAELAERRFRIVDADGAVVFDGDLPEFESFDGKFDDWGDWDDTDAWDDMGDWEDWDAGFEDFDWGDLDWSDFDFGFDEPERGRNRRDARNDSESPTGPFTAPFTLEIADADGTLTEVGELGEVLPPEFEFGFALYGGDEGPQASASLDRITDRGESFETLFFSFENDGRGTSHVAEFSSFDDDFPVDALELSDLGGRAFEVRNDAGDTVLSGNLPSLGDDSEERTGTAADDAGDGPFTLWIADADGTLTEVTDLELLDFGFGDFESGFGLYGDEEGLNAAVAMDSFAGCPGMGDEDETHESFSVSFCVPGDDETDELLYELYASNEDDTGLPLGVETVGELEGLSFEIRNAAGDAVITGDLPMMDDSFIGWEIPEFEGTAAEAAGEAPFTLWIDDAGTLTEVGELEEFSWDWDWDDGNWDWDWDDDWLDFDQMFDFEMPMMGTR